MFTKHGIFTQTEIFSRQEILYEGYSKVINIEALTMAEMARRDILPAVSTYIKELSEIVNLKASLSFDVTSDYEAKLLKKLSDLSLKLYKATEKLENEVKNIKGIEDKAKLADAYKNKVVPQMAKVREIADELEVNTASKYWPYPTYGDLLFGIQ